MNMTLSYKILKISFEMYCKLQNKKIIYGMALKILSFGIAISLNWQQHTL